MFSIRKREHLTYKQFCNRYENNEIHFWTDFREGVYNWVATELGIEILNNKTMGMIWLIGAIAAENGMDAAFDTTKCLYNLLIFTDTEDE